MSDARLEIPPVTPVTRLLVPIDGSELSQRAAPLARLLASRLGVDLSFLAVATFDDEPRELGRAVTEAARGFESVVLDTDDVAGGILEAARSLAGTVVCMASHGRGRSAGLLGSVAAAVVARSEEPVIMVGPRAETHLPVERLVACVDGSREGEDAVPVAAAFAEALAVGLSLVTVADPLPEPVSAGACSSGPRAPARYLRSLASFLEEAGVEVTTKTIYDPVGVPAGLREFLEGGPPALVAAATHARTGISRLVKGSTAATLVHRLPAPVLLVREKGRGLR